jgi:hypothetical protein
MLENIFHVSRSDTIPLQGWCSNVLQSPLCTAVTESMVVTHIALPPFLIKHAEWKDSVPAHVIKRKSGYMHRRRNLDYYLSIGIDVPG